MGVDTADPAVGHCTVYLDVLGMLACHVLVPCFIGPFAKRADRVEKVFHDSYASSRSNHSHCDRHSCVTASPGLHQVPTCLLQSCNMIPAERNAQPTSRLQAELGSKSDDNDRVMISSPSRPVPPRNAFSRPLRVFRPISWLLGYMLIDRAAGELVLSRFVGHIAVGSMACDFGVATLNWCIVPE